MTTGDTGSLNAELHPMDGIVRAREAASHFTVDLQSIRELGHGHINATYLVLSGDRSIILQRINPSVFADPLAVVRNFVRITGHLARENLRCGGRYLVPSPIATRSGQPYWEDREGGVWRAQSALDGAAAGMCTGRSQAAEIGRCLGWFHRLTSAVGCGDYEVPLPGFHVLPQYLAMYDRVASEACRRWSSAERRCLEVVEEMRSLAPLFQRLCVEGALRQRIVHGDPKVENFLFDKAGGVVSLIDLDTVGPGLLHHDLGDCLRSGCNRSGEDADAASICFDVGICQALYQGYVTEMGGLLSMNDRRLIFEALQLITFELGLRFFTDHLNGDSYFRVRRPGENLDRAIAQFALLESVMRQEDDIRAVFQTVQGLQD